MYESVHKLSNQIKIPGMPIYSLSHQHSRYFMIPYNYSVPSSLPPREIMTSG